VKLTSVPAQIVLLDAEIAIVGITGASTVIVTVPDVTVAVVAHTSLEVNSAYTWSPEARAVLVYTLLFEPTGEPLRYH
jgi:hypothetical protein